MVGKWFGRSAVCGALALLGVQAANAQPVKPVVAVESVKGGNEQVPDLRTMIETEILNTNRFTVMTPKQADELEKSRSLCSDNQVWRAGRCVAGKVIVPDYSISATITTAAAEPVSLNLFQKMDKVISGKTCVDANTLAAVKPRLSVDIRVVSSTNQITAGERIDASDEKVPYCDNVRPDTTAAFSRLTRKVANSITRKLVLTSFPIEVIDVQPGNKLMLTYGEDVLDRGQQVILFRKGPDRTDSQGRKFTTEIQLGIAQVITLTPDSSIADLLCTTGGTAPQVGDLARMAPDAKAKKQKPAKGTTLPGLCQ